MKCENCGYELKEGEEVCPKCGSEVVAEAVSATLATTGMLRMFG